MQRAAAVGGRSMGRLWCRSVRHTQPQQRQRTGVERCRGHHGHFDRVASDLDADGGARPKADARNAPLCARSAGMGLFAETRERGRQAYQDDRRPGLRFRCGHCAFAQADRRGAHARRRYAADRSDRGIEHRRFRRFRRGGTRGVPLCRYQGAGECRAQCRSSGRGSGGGDNGIFGHARIPPAIAHRRQRRKSTRALRWRGSPLRFLRPRHGCRRRRSARADEGPCAGKACRRRHTRCFRKGLRSDGTERLCGAQRPHGAQARRDAQHQIGSAQKRPARLRSARQ